jgi:hypothetical protein
MSVGLPFDGSDVDPSEEATVTDLPVTIVGETSVTPSRALARPRAASTPRSLRRSA